MDRSSYGATAEMIGRITDPAQLTAMMKNPQYSGYTNVIIARLQEINHMRQAAQGAAPQPPTIAQQAIQGAQQSMQPPQAMAHGGIVGFKGGGKVKDLGQYRYQQEEYVPETPHEVRKEITIPVPVGPSLIRDAARGQPAGPTSYSPYYEASTEDEAMQQKARGGIVAFKAGGKVKDLGQYKYQQEEYVPETPHEVSKEITIPTPVGPSLIRDAVRGQPAGPTAYSPYYEASVEDDATQKKARGGIVAFKDGGKVKRFAKGGETKDDSDATVDPYAAGWRQFGGTAKKIGAVAADVSQLPIQVPLSALRSTYNVAAGLPNALGANIPYVDEGNLTPYYDKYVRSGAAPAGASIDAMSGAAPAVTPAGTPVPTPAPAPASLPPLTAKEMGFSPIGMGISSLMSRSGGGAGAKPLSAYTDEELAALGPNVDLAEARANIASQKANALNNALMYAGLGMARGASTSPQQGFLGNLATGATEGLTSYDQQEQQRQQMLRALGQQERAERAGIVRGAVAERGQDVRAAQAAELQRMGLGLQAQALKGPALQEQAIQRRAVALVNQARAKGTYSGDPTDYEMQARQEFAGATPMMQAAQLRANAARDVGTVAGWNKYQAINGPISFQAYQQMVGGGAATGQNYGTLE